MWQILFFKHSAENEAGRLLSGPFLFYQTALYKVKQVVMTLVLTYFGRPPLGHTIKTDFT